MPVAMKNRVGGKVMVACGDGHSCSELLDPAYDLHNSRVSLFRTFRWLRLSGEPMRAIHVLSAVSLPLCPVVMVAGASHVILACAVGDVGGEDGNDDDEGEGQNNNNVDPDFPDAALVFPDDAEGDAGVVDVSDVTGDFVIQAPGDADGVLPMQITITGLAPAEVVLFTLARHDGSNIGCCAESSCSYSTNQGSYFYPQMEGDCDASGSAGSTVVPTSGEIHITNTGEMGNPGDVIKCDRDLPSGQDDQ